MNTIKAVQCHYCDQLHHVQKEDLIQRQGRPYYLVTCPLTQITMIIRADAAVVVR